MALTPVRFLVLQPAFIGDVVLALPIAQALAKAYPAAEIHFLVRKGNEGLLAHHPQVHRVWVWDKRRKYRSLWHLIRQLRRYRFQAVVNPHRFLTSGLVTLAMRAKEKVGFCKNPLSWAYTHCLVHSVGTANTATHQHEVERNLSLVQALVPTATVEPPRLYPSAEDVQAVYDALGGRLPVPFVVIAPTSVWFTKQWPLAQWAQLIEALPADVTMLLLGAPTDTHACEALVRALPPLVAPRVLNLAGRLSLVQSAALMARAVRVFANDSAPLHLASAVNTPTTAVFCSTLPAFGFGPLADGSTVVETPEPLACRPCGLHGKRACPEGHFRCAWGIDPVRVAQTLTNPPQDFAPKKK